MYIYIYTRVAIVSSASCHVCEDKHRVLRVKRERERERERERGGGGG